MTVPQLRWFFAHLANRRSIENESRFVLASSAPIKGKAELVAAKAIRDLGVSRLSVAKPGEGMVRSAATAQRALPKPMRLFHGAGELERDWGRPRAALGGPFVTPDEAAARNYPVNARMGDDPHLYELRPQSLRPLDVRYPAKRHLLAKAAQVRNQAAKKGELVHAARADEAMGQIAAMKFPALSHGDIDENRNRLNVIAANVKNILAPAKFDSVYIPNDTVGFDVKRGKPVIADAFVLQKPRMQMRNAKVTKIIPPQ